MEAAIAMIVRRRNVSDSSTSSDSDDLWEAAGNLRGKRYLRPRVDNYIELTARYSNEDFKSHFRMSRGTFESVLEIIQEDLKRPIKGNPAISPRCQLMIAIWKMATMDSYRSVCDRFNVGRATAVRAMRRVTHALFIRAPTFIQWPSGDRAVSVMRDFEEASGFPNIIGAIDGTHIKIIAPKENAVDYINRKGFHSLQLQLVCDQKMIITHAYTGHPGSLHDQRVFRQSEVSDYVTEETKFPRGSHLVGDGAYELREHMLTPFRDNGHLTGSQRNYNFRHSQARISVERCIGLLKGRMRSLLHCLPMTRIDLMAEYIIACCVVHNICQTRGDTIAVISINQEPNAQLQNVQPVEGSGANKRNAIMQLLPQ